MYVFYSRNVPEEEQEMLMEISDSGFKLFDGLPDADIPHARDLLTVQCAVCYFRQFDISIGGRADSYESQTFFYVVGDDHRFH